MYETKTPEDDYSGRKIICKHSELNRIMNLTDHMGFAEYSENNYFGLIELT